jgi:hypothetical protein
MVYILQISMQEVQVHLHEKGQLQDTYQEKEGVQGYDDR